MEEENKGKEEQIVIEYTVKEALERMENLVQTQENLIIEIEEVREELKKVVNINKNAPEYKKQLEQYKFNISQLENKERIYNDSITRNQKELDEILKNEESYEKAIAEIQIQTNDLQKQYDQKQFKIAKLETEKEEKQNLIDLKLADIEYIENEIEELENTYSKTNKQDERDKIEEEINDKTSHISQIKENIGELETEKNKKDEKVIKLKQEQDTIENKIIEIEQKPENAEKIKEFNKFQTEKQYFEELISKDKAELDEIVREKTEYQDESVKIEEQLSTYEAEFPDQEINDEYVDTITAKLENIKTEKEKVDIEGEGLLKVFCEHEPIQEYLKTQAIKDIEEQLKQTQKEINRLNNFHNDIYKKEIYESLSSLNPVVNDRYDKLGNPEKVIIGKDKKGKNIVKNWSELTDEEKVKVKKDISVSDRFADINNTENSNVETLTDKQKKLLDVKKEKLITDFTNDYSNRIRHQINKNPEFRNGLKNLFNEAVDRNFEEITSDKKDRLNQILDEVTSRDTQEITDAENAELVKHIMQIYMNKSNRDKIGKEIANKEDEIRFTKEAIKEVIEMMELEIEDKESKKAEKDNEKTKTPSEAEVIRQPHVRGTGGRPVYYTNKEYAGTPKFEPIRVEHTEYPDKTEVEIIHKEPKKKWYEIFKDMIFGEKESQKTSEKEKEEKTEEKSAKLDTKDSTKTEKKIDEEDKEKETEKELTEKESKEQEEKENIIYKFKMGAYLTKEEEKLIDASKLRREVSELFEKKVREIEEEKKAEERNRKRTKKVEKDYDRS